jgi:hypothetical protein
MGSARVSSGEKSREKNKKAQPENAKEAFREKDICFTRDNYKLNEPERMGRLDYPDAEI